jgi:hypothetical protein
MKEEEEEGGGSRRKEGARRTYPKSEVRQNFKPFIICKIYGRNL